MSKSAKSNLGHKRRLTHAQKRKMAGGMATERFEIYNGVFNKLAWRRRKYAIMQRVKLRETRARYWAEVRKGQRAKKEMA